jgi:superfamily II DNA helicase RecQ
MHRRMLDVTLPPRRHLERMWRDEAFTARQPAEVRASAERLRLELHRRDGTADWRPLERRRASGAARIHMMARFAAGWGCRRRRLLAYFGERAGPCAGCDWCDRWRRGRVAAPVARAPT